MFTYRKATIDDLNKIWNKDILKHNNDSKWINWKEQYINYNLGNKAVTFVVLNDDEPIGQITLILSVDCKAVLNKPMLCDGKFIANMNAFRIDKEFEGQGHISKLQKLVEEYAKNIGIRMLTIGVEPNETRNLAIYLHFGYTKFILATNEEDEGLVLYFGKEI